MTDPLPIRQRTVSASEAEVIKPAGAVSSVFDAGRKARGPRVMLPPLDVAKLQIRKDVPLPPPSGSVTRASRYKALLDRMQPGDSVELPRRHASSLVAYAREHGIKVAVRRVSGEVTALWRL